MNYNQPLQYLTYFASKTTKAVYLRSNVNILAKAGTTFSRKNIISNKRSSETNNTAAIPPPDYLIEYAEVIDNSRTTDGIFSDVVDIKLFVMASFPIKETILAIGQQVSDYFLQYKINEFRVKVTVSGSSPTGVVTTTITEKSDIEIV